MRVVEKVSLVGALVAVLIRRRLASQAPGLARAQRRAWRDAANVLTAAQLDAILNAGELTPATQAALTAGVTDFVNGPLRDEWQSALRAGGRALDSSFELLSRDRINNWIARNGAELIAQQTAQQRAAVKALLASSAEGDRATLHAALRATVGLTERQARALASVNAAAIEEGVSPAQRRALVERATRRAQRQRADRIARTELAHAFNGGVDEAVSAGVESGTFNAVTREWRTQRDERADCVICKDLDGKTAGMGEAFNGLYQTPPAHPNCRCVLLYRVQ